MTERTEPIAEAAAWMQAQQASHSGSGLQPSDFGRCLMTATRSLEPEARSLWQRKLAKKRGREQRLLEHTLIGVEVTAP
jgi:hypothetical protein